MLKEHIQQYDNVRDFEHSLIPIGSRQEFVK